MATIISQRVSFKVAKECGEERKSFQKIMKDIPRFKCKLAKRLLDAVPVQPTRGRDKGGPVDETNKECSRIIAADSAKLLPG